MNEENDLELTRQRKRKTQESEMVVKLVNEKKIEGLSSQSVSAFSTETYINGITPTHPFSPTVSIPAIQSAGSIDAIQSRSAIEAAKRESPVKKTAAPLAILNVEPVSAVVSSNPLDPLAKTVSVKKVEKISAIQSIPCSVVVPIKAPEGLTSLPIPVVIPVVVGSSTATIASSSLHQNGQAEERFDQTVRGVVANGLTLPESVQNPVRSASPYAALSEREPQLNGNLSLSESPTLLVSAASENESLMSQPLSTVLPHLTTGQDGQSFLAAPVQSGGVAELHSSFSQVDSSVLEGSSPLTQPNGVIERSSLPYSANGIATTSPFKHPGTDHLLKVSHLEQSKEVTSEQSFHEVALISNNAPNLAPVPLPQPQPNTWPQPHNITPPLPTPTPKPEPQPIPHPTPKPGPQPTPKPTPKPTPHPVPGPEPTPERYEVEKIWDGHSRMQDACVIEIKDAFDGDLIEITVNQQEAMFLKAMTKDQLIDSFEYAVVHGYNPYSGQLWNIFS